MASTSNTPQKQQQYKALVSTFKKQKFSDPNLLNPFHIKEVKYDFEVLNPWNLWHGNIDADILLIGQDWGDLEYFKKNFSTNWEPEKNSPTNKNLQKLFTCLGCDIGLPDFLNRPQYFKRLPLYFTNAVLGIKSGGMAAAIKNTWFDEMGIYLIGLINIIQPKTIIVMGKNAYDHLKLTYDLPSYKNAEEGILNNGKHPPINGANLFLVAHCSGLGLRNRVFEKQKQDWLRINDLITNNPFNSKN